MLEQPLRPLQEDVWLDWLRERSREIARLFDGDGDQLGTGEGASRDWSDERSKLADGG